MTFGGNQFALSTSIGIVQLPDHGSNISDLLRDADIALYRAKAAGKDSFCWFEPQMLADALERLTLKVDLHALGEHPEELEMHYQPIIDLATGVVVGTEALARWRHPAKGLLYPASFMESAERSGAIIAIGESVLRSVCAQASRWMQSGTVCPVAINISRSQLMLPNFVGVVRQALEERELPGEYLTLELSESLTAGEIETAIAQLHGLRELGVRIAIDSFGSGHASLEFLRRLPIDFLKIGRTFTISIAEDERAAVLMELMNQIAHAFGFRTIAEGIETPGQLQMARQIGCDLAQGFLIAPPVPPDEIAGLLSEVPPWTAVSP